MTRPALAYYNENDPEKVAALRALMADGWIAPGEIDGRDLRDVTAAELSRFTQCHFFAGIGLWSVAARQAGIPDDFPFWSGSCPCQPFSAAGAGEGVADDRHLWPHWFWLIAQQRPSCLVGEQVATQDGLAWLDLVCADMEGSGYAGGSLDLCSAGFGAPNIRQRLYMCWLDNIIGDGREAGRQAYHGQDDGIVSDADGSAGRMADPEYHGRGADQSGRGPQDGIASGRGSEGRDPDGMADVAPGRRGIERGPMGTGEIRHPDGGRDESSRMDDGQRAGLEGQRRDGDDASGRQPGSTGPAAPAGDLGGLAGPDGNGQQSGGLSAGPGRSGEDPPVESRDGEGGGDRGEFRDQVRNPTNGFWTDTDWLLCRDPDGPKLRPVKSGTFCLAAGHPGRPAELRAFGDAINLQVATEFLKAVKPEMMANHAKLVEQRKEDE